MFETYECFLNNDYNETININDFIKKDNNHESNIIYISPKTLCIPLKQTKTNINTNNKTFKFHLFSIYQCFGENIDNNNELNINDIKIIDMDFKNIKFDEFEKFKELILEDNNTKYFKSNNENELIYSLVERKKST